MGILYKRLKDYSDSDYYGFHMPGHKRNGRFLEELPGCRIDITEIDGFDDLHHAQGILREAQERAAHLFGAGETHFLINGSTVGILSGILGVTNRGDRILVARNCHKSVYHAICMNELDPVYLYPGFNKKLQLNMEISVQDVRKALEEDSQIRAVVIVSPTYDGVVSDVQAIAQAAHEKGVPLIVDEAHGAHFGFHPYFPENSNAFGADVVIHSVHKTLPALTQTALLHMNGSLVNRRRIKDYLHMLQSSSPSYLLMAGMDSCIYMLETGRKEMFSSYTALLRETRQRLESLKRLRMICTERFDNSKLIISVKNTDMNGKELYDLLLKRYHLQMEMAAGTYVLAMTSVGDTPEGLNRLIRALFEVDGELDDRMKEKQTGRGGPISGREEGSLFPTLAGRARLPEVCRIFEAKRMLDEPEGTYGKKIRAAQEKSAGGIALEYAYLYPPGIPLIVPGELITEEAARLLGEYRQAGYRIEGPEEEGKIYAIYRT